MSPENAQALADAERYDRLLHVEELTAHVRRLVAENEAIALERDGERKAKELVLKGLESVTELYDGQKHEVRALRERVKALEAALKPMVRCFQNCGSVPEYMVTALAALLSEAPPS